MIGVDFNEDGGGLTLAGMRIGGGKNGVEIGPNVGLGAQVNGNGAYVGTGGKLTVGGDGVKASAGAKAIGGDQEAGAGVQAGVTYKGKFYADAVSTTSSIVNSARGKWDEATKDLQKCQESLEKASFEEQSAKNARDQAKKDMDAKQRRLNELRGKRNTAATNKTKLLNLKTNKTTEIGDAKQLLESAKSRLNKATKGNKLGEILRESGEVEKQTVRIDSLEAEIKLIDAELKLLLEYLKQSEKALEEAQKAVTNGRQELKYKTEKWEKSKTNHAGSKRSVEVASGNVEKKRKEHSIAVNAYNKAKEEQRAYQSFQ